MDTNPSEQQELALRACYEYYRDSTPPGMRVEFYANWVRIEPGAFGWRRAMIDGIAVALAGQVPDEFDVVTGPRAFGVDQAREQFQRALLLEVPEGFVRVSISYQGFEEEGDAGVIYLVLKERWEQDRPF